MHKTSQTKSDFRDINTNLVSISNLRFNIFGRIFRHHYILPWMYSVKVVSLLTVWCAAESIMADKCLTHYQVLICDVWASSCDLCILSCWIVTLYHGCKYLNVIILNFRFSDTFTCNRLQKWAIHITCFSTISNQSYCM